MSSPSGIFAPPRASLELHGQSGEVRAEGKLVRMERSGRLPDRCVACNAPADGPRLARTLNYLAASWRVVLITLPLLVLFFGDPFGIPFASALIFPLAAICLLTYLLLRRRVTVDLGICARHRRQRTVLYFAASACLGVVLIYVLLVFLARDWSGGVGPLALVALLAMLGLAVAEAMSGARRISVVRLDAKHVWFKGMGEAFRASLPDESQPKG
ncbi:MAG: hypothetical protein ACKVQQ_15290 [Burkholderiales bacterium]